MRDEELLFCFNCTTIHPTNHPAHHTSTTFIAFAYKKVSPHLLSHVYLSSISCLISTATIMVWFIRLFENIVIETIGAVKPTNLFLC